MSLRRGPRAGSLPSFTNGPWLVCVDKDDKTGAMVESATYSHRTATAAMNRLGSIISCYRRNGRKEYRPIYSAGKRFYSMAPDGEILSLLELRNRLDLINTVA